MNECGGSPGSCARRKCRASQRRAAGGESARRQATRQAHHSAPCGCCPYGDPRRDRASTAVDASDFSFGLDLNIEPLVKHLLRGHQQPALIRNDIADVIRQPAICEGHVRTAIEHDYFKRFISRRSRAAQEAPPATPPTISTRSVSVLREAVDCGAVLRIMQSPIFDEKLS